MMREVNLTQGPILGRLVRFSLPMIAGNMLQQVYNLVDTLVVGRGIGAQALAAVGSAYTLMTFLTSILIGLCMGSGAFFSEDYGAGDGQQLRKDVHFSFWFVFAVCLLIYAVIYPCMNPILRLLQTPAELMTLMREYLNAVFAGIFFVFLYNFFAYLLRSMGNSVAPLLFLAVSAVLNIVLDIRFVMGLSMGVAGAAWATVISQAISGLGIAAYSFARLPQLRRRADGWEWGRFGRIVKNDVTTGIQQSVMNFGILMVQGLVNSFGTVIMAAFAAAVKIDTLAYMPAQEFGNAYSLFVSQNFGAGERRRIRKGTKLSFALSAAFCALVSVGIFLLAPQLMGCFVDAAETEVIAQGVRYLRIEGAAYVGIGVLFLWYGYFRGIRRPEISLILTVISLGTRVGLAYALAPGTALGVNAIWLAIPIGWVLADAAGAWFYRKTGARLTSAGDGL